MTDASDLEKTLTIKFSDYILRDHRVHDVRIMPGVTFLDGGTLSFTLAEPIAEHDSLIVVDAARFGEPAGTVRNGWPLSRTSNSPVMPEARFL